MAPKTKRNKRKQKRKQTRKQTRKRKKNTKKFIKDRCSPKLDINSLPFTCYTKDSLHKLKEIWNTKHPQNKIKSNNNKTIWKQLKNRMSNTCNRESCWLNNLYEREGLKSVEYDEKCYMSVSWILNWSRSFQHLSPYLGRIAYSF